jgi:hypothetical protein
MACDVSVLSRQHRADAVGSLQRGYCSSHWQKKKRKILVRDWQPRMERWTPACMRSLGCSAAERARGAPPKQQLHHHH